MNEITVTPQTLGSDLTQTVNAKDVHAELGVKKDFTDWVKAQIRRARLVENRDFLTVPQKGDGADAKKGVGDSITAKGADGRFVASVEYHLTIDAAKHVAMMSNTARGAEIREYFIEVEKAHTSGRLQAEIANAEARVRAEMVANQPVNLLDWLSPTSVAYFGKPGTSHPERRYFAVLEARRIGYATIARKYGISPATAKKWLDETTDADLHTIGHMLSRTNPLDAIQYDLDVEKQERAAAKLKLEKALQRLERKQLKLTQKAEALKLKA